MRRTWYLQFTLSLEKGGVGFDELLRLQYVVSSAVSHLLRRALRGEALRAREISPGETHIDISDGDPTHDGSISASSVDGRY